MELPTSEYMLYADNTKNTKKNVFGISNFKILKSN